MSKKIEYAFEGTKLVIKVDPNEDGQIAIEVKIDLMELPDEVMSLISAKKA